MAQRVGVIGGGQLAQMLGLTAQRLGIQLVVQTPQATDPAVAMASGVVLGAIEDGETTRDLAARVEVITFENEFVDLDSLQPLRDQGIQFRPDLSSLRPLLDKYSQRQFLQSLGLPTPRFVCIEPDSDLLPAADWISFPVILKARRHGYDGQGTQVIQTEAQLQTIRRQSGDTQWLLEEKIPFAQELAVVAARSATGQISIFPIVETQQQQQVCRRVLIPAEISEMLQEQIRAMVTRILEHLQVVGLFGVELFLVTERQVLINEISPRTHNSGHYTLEACQVSQFEQHLRAVCDLPLQNPALTCGAAVMVNLLGLLEGESGYGEKQERLEQIPGAHLHWYGKVPSRPGRKLGHVTVCLEQRANRQQLLELAMELEAIWYGEHGPE